MLQELRATGATAKAMMALTEALNALGKVSSDVAEVLRHMGTMVEASDGVSLLGPITGSVEEWRLAPDCLRGVDYMINVRDPRVISFDTDRMNTGITSWHCPEDPTLNYHLVVGW